MRSGELLRILYLWEENKCRIFVSVVSEPCRIIKLMFNSVYLKDRYSEFEASGTTSKIPQ